MRTEDKIKQRVQKLLNQARDREGTPEGDVFYARAFELMAQYGYEQRDIDGPEPSEVGQRAYEFTGSYTEMQANLLLTIAAALHCRVFSARVQLHADEGRRHFRVHAPPRARGHALLAAATGDARGRPEGARQQLG